MKVVSFDIWDTCLTRSFSEPKHLFLEVARRISGAELFEDPETAELARFRILAERLAREKAPGSECRFDEIKTELEKLVIEETCKCFMNLVLAVELEFVRQVAPVCDQRENVRGERSTIAFVSSTTVSSKPRVTRAWIQHECYWEMGLAASRRVADGYPRDPVASFFPLNERML